MGRLIRIYSLKGFCLFRMYSGFHPDFKGEWEGFFDQVFSFFVLRLEAHHSARTPIHSIGKPRPLRTGARWLSEPFPKFLRASGQEQRMVIPGQASDSVGLPPPPAQAQPLQIVLVDSICYSYYLSICLSEPAHSTSSRRLRMA